MAEIILHIGTPKTGTTAIQSALTASEGVLRQAGIAFMKTGRHRAAHNDLAMAITRHGDAHKFRKDFSNEFQAEMNAPDVGKILISSEIFTLISPRRFKKSLPEIAEHSTKIVVYLRRQDQYAEAFYKQRLKNGRISIPFTEFLEARVGQRITDYNGLLSGWAATFPNAKIVPRIYDRRGFVDGDITSDFASVLDFDPKELKSPAAQRNISPSREVIDILMAMAPMMSGAELRKVYHAAKSKQIEGFSGSGDLFRASERRAYFERFTEANEALRLTYFPEKPELFREPAMDVDPQQIAGFTEVQKGLISALFSTAAEVRAEKT